MFKSSSKFRIVAIVLKTVLVVNIIAIATSTIAGLITHSYASAQRQVKLKAILAAPEDRWIILVKNALQEMRSRHFDMNIQLNYTILPYNVTRTQILKALADKIPLDLVSVDQIWLDFAQKGILTDVTNYVNKWGRASDWYQTNFGSGVYKGKVYGIWAWTDIRGM